jgi:hypothetical protein
LEPRGAQTDNCEPSNSLGAWPV